MRLEDGVAGEIDVANRISFDGIFEPLPDERRFGEVRGRSRARDDSLEPLSGLTGLARSATTPSAFPDANVAGLGPVLRASFDLTPTEADVTLRLLAGARVEAIARELEVSVNTIRTHLKRTFSKLDVTCQTELVRIIARGAAAVVPAGGASDRGRAIPITDADEERRHPRSHAEPPLDRVWGDAGRLNGTVVEAVQVVSGADGRAIPAQVVAAARAEADVVVVEVPARAAGRDRAAPAVTGEDRIVMARRALPEGDDVAQEPFEPDPAGLGRIGEGVEDVPQQCHDGGRPREAYLGVRDLEHVTARGRRMTIFGISPCTRARDARPAHARTDVQSRLR